MLNEPPGERQPATEPVPPAVEHRAAVGRHVRALRRGHGLTLRDLAGQLEVSIATVSAIENGKTGISSQRMVRLAELLDVPVGELFLTAAPSPRSGVQQWPRPAREVSPVPVSRLAPDEDWRTFSPLVLDAALRGALASFLEFGYHGATMRVIADRAGLSVPGLYHHYPSKQAMLVAVLDLTMHDLLARTRSARDEGEDPVERFCNLVECLALYHTHRRELGFVGASEMRSLSVEPRERVAALRREQQHMVDLEVEQGVALGVFGTHEPQDAARAVVTMCTALPQWFHESGPASAEQVAAQYVGFALRLVEHVPSD